LGLVELTFNRRFIMSLQITTAMIEEFSSNVQHLSQQKDSRLGGSVRTESIGAEAAAFDQIGITEANDRATRNGDTVIIEVPHARRWVIPITSDWAALIDRPDKLKVLMDPVGEYAVSAVAAMNRRKDKHIIQAAFATSVTGKQQGDSEVFDTANQQIASASTSMTLTKLLEIKEIFDQNEVDDEIPRHIAISAKELRNLLNTTEIKDADFNTVKALARGQINDFLGFNFHRTEKLENTAASERRCIAWAEDGILLAANSELSITVNQRPDKNNAWQVHLEFDMGATRMENKKVVEILTVPL
jgi:hypothetical protein